MNIKDIRFGTQEYGKLNDDEKLLVINREMNELFNNPGKKTITVKYGGINKTIPYSKHGYFKNLYSNEKSLMKKNAVSLDIFSNSRNSNSGFFIRNVDSKKYNYRKNNKELIINILKSDADSKKIDYRKNDKELIINLPKRNVDEKKLNIRKEEYGFVFTDFFNKTIGKEKDLEDDNYNIVFDKQIDKRQNESTSKEVFQIPFEFFFNGGTKGKQLAAEYDNDNDNDLIIGYEKSRLKPRRTNIMNKVRGLFSKFKNKKKEQEDNLEKMFDKKRKKECNGKFVKSGSKSILSSGEGKFLKIDREKEKKKKRFRVSAAAIGLASLITFGLFSSWVGKKVNRKVDNLVNNDITSSGFDEINNETEIMNEIGYDENISVSDSVLGSNENIVLIQEEKNFSETIEETDVKEEDKHDNVSFNDVITLKDNSYIYGSPMDAAIGNNYLNPYFDNSYEREVMGVVYELNGNIYTVYGYEDNSSEKSESLINQGAKEVAVLVVRTDMVNTGQYEGFYKIDDVVKEEDNMVKTRVRNN